MNPKGRDYNRLVTAINQPPLSREPGAPGVASDAAPRPKADARETGRESPRSLFCHSTALTDC